MTQPTRSPTTARVPMDAMRKTALVAGILYLITLRPVIATSAGPA